MSASKRQRRLKRQWKWKKHERQRRKEFCRGWRSRKDITSKAYLRMLTINEQSLILHDAACICAKSEAIFWPELNGFPIMEIRNVRNILRRIV